MSPVESGWSEWTVGRMRTDDFTVRPLRVRARDRAYTTCGTDLASRRAAVAYLSFADLITGPIRLSPAEAAALTLAVARQLDGEGRHGSDARLPDDHGILLSSTGTVAFVRGAEAPAPDNHTALSALLMRLLRLDEEPRAQVPGGLLIVLARNLGYIQLPPTSPDVFRAALERFATPDPTLLAGIFWRGARVKGAVPRRASGGADAAPARVDRRRGGPTRADLRRALRELEHDLFNTRRRLHRTSSRQRQSGPLRPFPSMNAMLRWTGVAAGVVLLASIAAGNGTKPAPPAAAPATPVVATTEAPSVVPASRTIAPVRPRVVGPGTASPARASVARVASVTSVTRKAATARHPQRRERRPVTPDAPARRFAGGARQIGWTLQR
jgi:hypothetical protein